jgi:5-formyltetrahydrofolate cyclo-ligase
MEKSILRKQMLANLRDFAQNPAAKIMLEKELYQKLYQTAEWKNAKTIGLTLSQNIEINTLPIIEQARLEGKQVAIPKTREKPQMDFFLYEVETELVRSSFGLLEPTDKEQIVRSETIDLLLVPGVAFHDKGYRIGFGGGFYDTYLKNFHGVTISLAFAFQLNSNWQPDSFDYPVAKILTNGRIL